MYFLLPAYKSGLDFPAYNNLNTQVYYSRNTPVCLLAGGILFPTGKKPMWLPVE
jgi:hypothetical protein